MNGILIAALITSVLAVVIYAPIIAKLAPKEARLTLAIAAIVMLPMQPLAFHFVRMPLHAGLQSLLGNGPLLSAIALFYAPLTEEPAKWLVLLLPWVRRGLTRDRAVAIALATGVGFGIGEAWFIASRLGANPNIAALPFWHFSGFYVERLIVCFLHGAFVSFAFVWLSEGRGFVFGALVGIALHFALNFPILFVGIDLFGLGREVWSIIVFAWVIAMTIALAVAISRMTGGALRRATLGTATCPSCHTVYDRPLLALNLGWKRYERCPNCRTWHLV